MVPNRPEMINITFLTRFCCFVKNVALQNKTCCHANTSFAKCLEIDLTTYNTLDEGNRGIIYCFEWEMEENEKKRDIKLVDPRFAATIFGEHSEKYE